jgi:ketosteroid isomerase-like protein
MTSSSADAAKAVVLRWLGPAWSEGDYAVLPECIAPNATIRFLAGGEPRPYGPTQAEAHIREARARVSDYRYTVHRLVAEGDTVVAVTTFGGVHDRGPITTRAGAVVPPTGRRTAIAEVLVCRLAGGKIAEVQYLLDGTQLPQQLGVAPHAGAS